MTFKNIREGRFSKIIAGYLAIQMILQFSGASNLWALTGGPSQPEFNSFTPIGTSDMVNLSSGDFNYNIPIMDVGGYPLNLAYDSGVSMDQEASWVGLGWNLNVGQINRQVRGIPDDFNGDEIRYENEMKQNITVGTSFNLSGGVFGQETLRGGVGMGVQYNNYEGVTFKPTYGTSFALNDQVKIGINISSSVANGVTISPNVSLSAQQKEKEDQINSISSNIEIGVGYNSRQGLTDFSISPSFTKKPIKNKGNTGVINLNAGMNYETQTFTPYKRAGMNNGNLSFSASVGVTFFGVDGQAQITGYGSYQDIRESERNKLIKAYGYENTEANEGLNGVLDFNREKDRTFTKNTTVLPVTNYTHDLYSIQGQGISGAFRPFRSQVSYLYDNTVTDHGDGGSFGVKFGTGWNFYIGGEFEINSSDSRTGKWKGNNFALPKFKEKKNDANLIDYEKVYYKQVGELMVDTEPSIYNNDIYSNKPIKIGIGGSKHSRYAKSSYIKKETNANGTASYTEEPILTKIKRSKRDLKNTAIQKITQREAEHDPFIEHRTESFAKNHHTAGMKILKSDGSTYVYGKSAYNITKVEATFDVSGSSNPNCAKGTIGYNGNVRGNNSSGSDEFLNRITTPSYVHTYLLSSILSTDYEDISGDGPSSDDLGAYTKFHYDNQSNNVSNFKWRVPYNADEVSYNEGLKSKTNDQKGNYIYGEKEVVYISKIETKTHVAIFELSSREDGRSAKSELSSSVTTASYTKKINKIKLYSKPEYDLHKTLLEDTDESNDPVSPIKTAHFDYDYQLCQGVKNNLSGGGKLTLTKVFFTYRDSNMGAHTPYKFNYDGFNPDYNLKSYDVWGNYKPIVESAITEDSNGNLITNPNFDSASFCSINDEITAPEFPFVQQDNIPNLNQFAAAWSLTSIDLPSGGLMEINYETDDYQYVQDRKAMQMFKVSGVGNDSNPTNPNQNTLYNGSSHTEYLYVKIENQDASITDEEIIENHIGDLKDKEIYFKFLLNMVSGSNNQYDYVSGYFKIDQNKTVEIFDNRNYLSIPLKSLKKEGGWVTSNQDVNPIAKAGWYFGRSYLNREVYSIGGDSVSDDFASIVEDLVGSIGQIAEVFQGPNHKLQQKGCARKFVPEKSWIRLLSPNKRKFGGGVRVNKIKMHDNWDQMTDNTGFLDVNNNNPYKQFYGQEYAYTNEDGSSSGVASFEPNGSKENPFVVPVYNKNDKLVAPKEFNFVEKPIGGSFFPSATVTYSRVAVNNLTRSDNNRSVQKHATGKVVTEFYTTYDFPTITDYTDITKKHDPTKFLGNLLSLNIFDKTHLTLSQGFVIETNDMNGKQKKQLVYAEGQSDPISGVEYVYSTDEKGKLNNNLTTINEKGEIENNQLIGVHYEVVNDFRESKSSSTTAGINANLTGFLAWIFPVIVPIPLPDISIHKDQLRVVTTTKVIHKTGVLKEKIAFDVGSKVSTENIAWDNNTGQVLLTKTTNEYDDAYYNFNYPAFWMYDGMGQASKNLNLSCWITPEAAPASGDVSGDEEGKTSWYKLRDYLQIDLNNYFAPGDEVTAYSVNGNFINRFWINEIKSDGKSFVMIDRNGHIANPCGDGITGDVHIKVVRSHRRNLQSASMASVTSMKNPATNDLINTNGFIYDGSGENPRIVNTSAVEYKDFWRPQNENNFEYPSNDILNSDNIVPYPYFYKNPFVNNIKGDWRAVKSYAYLTGRNNEGSPRNNGFFTSFNPFYNFNGEEWLIDTESWTFASEVTKYSPYGVELENKDALNRYSSAQYGYGYTLPTAVASNSEYRQMGFDGFEDYSNSTTTDSHFNFKESLIKFSSDLELSEEESHTGKYSLKISPQSKATIIQDNIYLVEIDTLDCAPAIIQPCIDCDEEISMGCGGGVGEVSFGNFCFQTPDDIDIISFVINSNGWCVYETSGGQGSGNCPPPSEQGYDGTSIGSFIFNGQEITPDNSSQLIIENDELFYKDGIEYKVYVRYYIDSSLPEIENVYLVQNN